MHFPGSRGSQAFAKGLHCTQGNRALIPMAMFIEMMRPRTRCLIQPSDKRQTVKAKLVLDQMAAVTLRVPVTVTPSTNRLMFWKGKSHV